RRRPAARVERGGSVGESLRKFRRGTIRAIQVGSFGGVDRETGESIPEAMTVTVDPRSVVGLDNVFTESKAGRIYDFETRGDVLAHDDVRFPPLAFLRVKLPEVELEFGIEFDVLEARRSLEVAVTTGRVLLIEPALSHAASLSDPYPAFEKYRWFGVEARES